MVSLVEAPKPWGTGSIDWGTGSIDWRTGLVVLWHVGSSQTRVQTCVPCIGRQILSQGSPAVSFFLFYTFTSSVLEFQMLENNARMVFQKGSFLSESCPQYVPVIKLKVSHILAHLFLRMPWKEDFLIILLVPRKLRPGEFNES